MSLASSQSLYLKGTAASAALHKAKSDGATARKASPPPVAASAGNGKRDPDSRDVDAELVGSSMPQKLVSGIAAASILANVALAPVAVAAAVAADQVYTEQLQSNFEDNSSAVSHREKAA